jgi:hypothetical protein
MSYPGAPPGRIAALFPAAVVGGAFLLFGAPPLFAAIIALCMWLYSRGEMT